MAFRALITIVVGVSSLYGCLPVQAYRLNPEAEPAEYRIVCAKKSAVCRSEAAEICDSEYEVLSRSSNFEEPDMNSPQVSRAPTTQGEWRGELHVRCSGGPPPLSLKRSTVPGVLPSAEAQGAAIPPARALAPAPAPSRVCVPGVTQPCLGPGACSGAQSCTRDGTGFSACDCGEAKVPAVTPSASPSASVAPVPSAAGPK